MFTVEASSGTSLLQKGFYGLKALSVRDPAITWSASYSNEQFIYVFIWTSLIVRVGYVNILAQNRYEEIVLDALIRDISH